MTTAPTRKTRRKRWRRAFALAAALVAVLTTTSFWLADSGIVSLPAAAAPTPSGATAGGSLATFTALTPSLVSPSRSGSSVGGMVMGKVTVAAGYANRVKVDIAWLDPNDAGKVLNNPNAWISFGLYAPLHTGSCSSESNADTISDGGSYCVQRIAATGPLVANDDTLTISETLLSGFMVEAASDPSTPVTCGSGTSSWCSPGLSNQNVFYVIATIYNAGGHAPSGQQSQAGTLSFYMDAHSIA